MDFAHYGTDASREEEMMSTKKRLETFQFRRTSGPTLAPPLSPTRSTSRRPHSRHGSVSSVSFSASNSTNSELSTASEQPSLSSSDSRPNSLVGRPRPTSHHRRRSSVSTRVESAEMMGVTLPELPASSSDDNINFGDKDSVRRRALQALEGMSDFGSSNSTVEIPDFSNQGVPHKPFDREFKLPTGGPSLGVSSLSGKRDSFGKFLSSANSLKDQLHTLMEEEEEEEEQEATQVSPDSVPRLSTTPKCEVAVSDCDVPRADFDAFDNFSASTSSGSARHRPANLTLRPLSLISSTSSPALPTPSLTPGSRAGLRSFSLAPQSDSHANNSLDSFDLKWANKYRRQSTDVHSNSSSSTSSTSVHCQSSSGSGSDPYAPPNPKRSSISYIRSGSSQPQPTAFTFASLPTPGATPTSERRQSTSSISSSGSIGGQEKRTVSEDMFMHQSHASLLARIAELERALQSRPLSRPVSIQSDSSLNASEPPPDEMLQLVADLKAERDELNRDIDGWRQRVKDLEHTKTLLGHEKAVLERRLEAEKREGWLKSEKLGLLEMEKGALDRQLKMKEENVSSVSRRLETTQAQLRQAVMECNSLREDAEVAKRQLAEAQILLEARKGTEVELNKVREALAAEQVYRGKLISQLDAAGILETPRLADKVSGEISMRMAPSRNNGLGFQSVDSACTTVDADEQTQQALRAPFTLKAVEEESETRDGALSDDDDELARYEEDDLDFNFTSPTRTMSSYGSDDDLPCSLSHLRLVANNTPVPSGSDVASSSRSFTSTPSPTSSPCPTPIPPLSPEVKYSQHTNRASLSKTWTFPRGAQPNSSRPLQEEVDRFFGCLEDIDNSPPCDTAASMDNRSMFSQGLQFGGMDDEELPPFILPAQKMAAEVGNIVLDAVLEEEEDDMHRGTSDGRSTSSFPVSVREDSLSSISPLFDGDMQAKSVPFVFPQMKRQQYESNPIASSPNNAGPVNASPRSTPTPTYRSAIVTPKLSSPRAIPPSRIPPPSPPMFIQAKPVSTRGTPSPPKRKPVPLSPSKVSPTFTSRIKPVGVTIDSPQKAKKPAPLPSYGSTFIPQLKATTDMNFSSFSSSSKPQKSPLDSLSTLAPKRDTNGTLNRHHFDPPAAPPSQPLLQTFTNYLPLPSFSWNKPVAPVRKPVFVSKERQLAKLRANMDNIHRNGIHPKGLDKCGRCQGDLISL